jgi:hypothetical protein
MSERPSEVLDAIEKPISSIEDAKGFFDVLINHNLVFHPEDDAGEICRGLNGPALFSEEEALLINQRTEEAYRLDWSSSGFECPCGYILAMTGDEPEE